MNNNLSYYTNKFYKNVFDDGKLKLSLPDKFNDVLDSHIRLTDSDLTSILKLLQDIEPTCTLNYVNYCIEKIKTILIICLNRQSPTSLRSSHMWGLYGNKGTGIAFEFDFNKVEHRFNKNLSSEVLRQQYFKEVNYTSNITIIYDRIISYLISSLITNTKNYKLRSAIQGLEIISFLTYKSIMWQHESEYRIFCPELIRSKILKIEHGGESYLNKFKDLKSLQNTMGKQQNFEYIQFDHNDNFTEIKDINLPLITLPFPDNIYLGWHFVEQDQEIHTIKQFCKAHKIKGLYQLTGNIDYINQKFEIGNNLLD